MSDIRRILEPRINRRTMLLGTAGAGLATILPGRTFAQQGTTIAQFIWTGAQEPVPRRLAEEFMASHPNVRIELTAGTNGATYPKLAASRTIDPEAPLINFGFFNMDATEKGRLVDMWLPIKESDVPNIAHILPDYRQADGTGAFFCMDPGGLVYNTQQFDQAPDSWEMLFDPKLKGRVCLFDGLWAGNGLVVTALLNGGSEDDIGVAIDMYAKAARDGQFHSLVTSNSQAQQLMVSGDVWLMPHFRGIAMAWAEAGAPVAYAVPREGQVSFPEGFQIVNGSSEEQVAACHELLNLSLAPENVLDYCTTAKVLPLMDNVALPAEMASDPAIQPEALSKAIKLDYAKIAANGAEWTNLWNRQVRANL